MLPTFLIVANGGNMEMYEVRVFFILRVTTSTGNLVETLIKT